MYINCHKEPRAKFWTPPFPRPSLFFVHSTLSAPIQAQVVPDSPNNPFCWVTEVVCKEHLSKYFRLWRPEQLINPALYHRKSLRCQWNKWTRLSSIEHYCVRAGEVAYWLKMTTAFAKDWRSFPAPHQAAYNHLQLQIYGLQHQSASEGTGTHGHRHPPKHNPN